MTLAGELATCPYDFLGLNNEEGLKRVVLVEIKAEKGAFSPRERQVRDVILQKRVEWEEFSIT